MQEENYCKETFGLQYPLLVLDGNAFDKKRYYAKPVTIDDEKYYLCSQWFETTSNDDKSLLIKWLAKYNIQI